MPMCVAWEEGMLVAMYLGGGEGGRGGFGAAGGGDGALAAEGIADAGLGVRVGLGVGECGVAWWGDTGRGCRAAACDAGCCAYCAACVAAGGQDCSC